MYTLDLIAAVESWKIDQNGTATMNSAPSYRTLMSDDIRTFKYLLIKDLYEVICTWNRTFNCWQNQRDVYNSKSFPKGDKYPQQFRLQVAFLNKLCENLYKKLARRIVIQKSRFEAVYSA